MQSHRSLNITSRCLYFIVCNHTALHYDVHKLIIQFGVVHTYHSVWIISDHSISSCNHVLERSYILSVCLCLLFFLVSTPTLISFGKPKFIGTYFSDIFSNTSKVFISQVKTWMWLRLVDKPNRGLENKLLTLCNCNCSSWKSAKEHLPLPSKDHPWKGHWIVLPTTCGFNLVQARWATIPGFSAYKDVQRCTVLQGTLSFTRHLHLPKHLATEAQVSSHMWAEGI